MPAVFIPANIRGIIYSIYALIGVVSGGIVVAVATMEVAQPTWLKVGLAVYVFLGGAIGYTAASNTPAAPSAQLAIVKPLPPTTNPDGSPYFTGP